jgi:hypothetical protein
MGAASAYAQNEDRKTGIMAAITRSPQRQKRTVTGNGSWVYHYDPELKSQSLDYGHPNSLRKK